MKKKYYICLYFDFWILFKIIPTVVFKKHNVVFYYIFENKSSKFVKKMKKLKLLFFFRKVSVESIPYEVSKMKTGDGRTVMEACYFDSFYGVVKDIEDKYLQNEDSVLVHLGKKLTAHKGDITFWVKHYTSLSVINQALLVDIVVWFKTNSLSPLYEEEISVIINRDKYGSVFISKYAHENNVPVMVFGSGKKMNESLFFIFCYNFWHLVLSCFSPFTSVLSNKKSGKGKICTYHYGDKSISNFQSERNHSTFWYPDSGISPEDILIFSQKSNEINSDEMREAQAKGFHLIACDGPKRKLNKLIDKHKSSLKSLKYFFEYSIEGLKLLFRVKNRYDYEVAKIVLVLLLNLPYWEDFFKENNVKVLFKPGVLFSWMDVAAKLADSAIISYQYSNLKKTIMDHLECSDVFFVWGKEHEGVYSSKHTKVGNFIQSGYAFDYGFNYSSKNALTIRENFKTKGAEFIISLFDEALGNDRKFTNSFINGIGIRKHILGLYRQIFRYVVENKEIGIIVKPKSNNNIKILRSNKEISRLIDLIEKEGRLKIFDSDRFPIEAGRASDLVIGMLPDSTPALECLLAGIPSVTFNSEDSGFSIRENISEKSEIVLNDTFALIQLIERLRDSKLVSDVFPDQSNFLNNRDAFRDGKAYLRIGRYIKSVFENMNNGLDKDDAIREANKIYSSLYGDDKVSRNHPEDSFAVKENV